MPNNFNKWKFIYDTEELIPFSEDKEALLWLKIKINSSQRNYCRILFR